MLAALITEIRFISLARWPFCKALGQGSSVSIPPTVSYSENYAIRYEQVQQDDIVCRYSFRSLILDNKIKEEESSVPADVFNVRLWDAGARRIIFGDPPEDQGPTGYDVDVPLKWQVLLDDALIKLFIRERVDDALSLDLDLPKMKASPP